MLVNQGYVCSAQLLCNTFSESFFVFHLEFQTCGFNSASNVLLNSLLNSLSHPLGFKEEKLWIVHVPAGRVGIHDPAFPVGVTFAGSLSITPAATSLNQLFSLYCWNRTWFAYEWKMLFNVWYLYPPPPCRWSWKSMKMALMWMVLQKRC